MEFVLTTMVNWLGETIIKSLLDKVWDKMKELGSQGGDVGDALSNLEISLIKIQPIISNAENMWIKDENLRQNVNKLLVLLKDVAYDAEDLLDKFQFQKLQQQIKTQGNEASHPMKKRKVGEDNNDVNEIKKIQEKLDNISTAMEKLLDSNNREKMQMINEINRVTGSTPVETQVFGRDNELNELMRLLLEQDLGGSGSGSSNNISVLTVTGMGGVGKTTLAQEAYNDKRVEAYFKLRIWVCVSEDFSMERLTKEIIESATKQKCDLSNFNNLQDVLKANITSKKFLLVLDDVWNEDMCKWDRHKWDNLCAPLRSGDTGSKVLVTTRNVKIANMVGSVNQIHLAGLDDDNSWAFFKKCAFGSQDSGDHPRLEAIAKEMVAKLKGLPLAARTLGGLLNIDMNERHWKKIMDSEIWKLPQEENGVLLVLQLSYQYLPAHLKRCFAFCSLFPKDYQFREDVLVRIWMAEGFFPAKENAMEDFGSGCFRELVSRSFFQKSQRPNRYVLHDLMHELAQFISRGETYRLEDGKPFEIPTMLRHLNIVSTDGKELRRMMEIHDYNKLRTLIYQWQYSSMNSILTCGFPNRLQSIRTLILKNCGLTEFPESIGVFIHLRYLDISGNREITELPISLFKYYNLQALILRFCNLNELPESTGDLIYLRYLDISLNANLNRLPESLCRLPNLQTLDLTSCNILQRLPQGMSRLINLKKLAAKDDLVSEITGVGKLTSLQSLSIFKVGKEHGQRLVELSGLTQLHGALRITSLENVESKEEAIAAKLQSKLHLDELVLQWTSDQDNDAFCDSEELLEHLQPNSTLKRLTISGYSGARSPSWLEAGSLSKLETLSLGDCKRWDDLSFIRKLSHLKSLLLKRLLAVKQIRQELFGSAESNCSYREWLPCLRALEIDNCLLLKRLPLLPPSLTTLTLHRVGLTEFPGIQEGAGGSSSNIATVSPLVVRISKYPNLTSLDRIECFPCLKSLDIEDCPLLTRLPPLPPSLAKLRLIQVGLTKIQGIGGSSSNIANVSLSVLQIRKCASLTNLGGIECSPCLSTVVIDNCPLLTGLSPLPPSLVKLELIQVGLTEFRGIDGSSSNIASVSPLVVRISKCLNLTSPDLIEYFPCLKSLDIEDCPLLTRLPPLPSSLVMLQLIQVGLTEITGIGGSSSNIANVSLSVLQIRKCADLTNLGGIECSPCLSTIVIDNCPLLTGLSPLPPSLVKLELIQVGLTEFRGIDGSSSNIASVSPLVVRISKCSNLTSLDLIEYFPCLKSLDIEDCPLLTRLPPLPSSLVMLQLIQVGLTEITGIGGSSTNMTFSRLVIKISDCPNLMSLDRIECFPCLESLEIKDCPLLTRLPPLPPSLELLELIQVGLTEFPGIQEAIGGSSSNIATVSPSVVRISKCLNLTSLDRIECFPCLKSLEIKDCPLLTRLPPLPPSLALLELIQVGLTEFPGIQEAMGGSSSNIAIVSPSVVRISKCLNLTSLHRIECFPCLKYLEIKDCPLLTRLPPLPPLALLELIQVGLTEFPRIQEAMGGSNSNIAIVSPSMVRISKCLNLTSLDRIECFPCLKYLEIKDCPLLTRLPPLPPSLASLELIQVGLTEFPRIQEAKGGNSSNIATLSPSSVRISKCLNLTSLDRIKCFPCLKSLKIKDCPLLTRLPPLPPSLELLELIQVGLTEFPGIQEAMGGSSSNIAIVSLIVVRISKCLNLISMDQIECFPCLMSLKIKDCPLLTRLPPLPLSLELLELIQVGLTEFSGIQEARGGSSSNIATFSPLAVRISKCLNLTSLDRIECFPCLKSLEIKDCPLLTRLPPLPPLELLDLCDENVERRGIVDGQHAWYMESSSGSEEEDEGGCGGGGWWNPLAGEEWRGRMVEPMGMWRIEGEEEVVREGAEP